MNGNLAKRQGARYDKGAIDKECTDLLATWRLGDPQAARSGFRQPQSESSVTTAKMKLKNSSMASTWVRPAVASERMMALRLKFPNRLRRCASAIPSISHMPNHMSSFFLPLLALAACAQSEETPPFRIPNGDMTIGEDLPTNWTKTWAGTGSVAVTRDTTIFHSPPAAMRLGSVNGPARGNVAVRVDINGAHAINLTGWIRTTGTLSAHVYAEAFTDDWSKSLAFMPVKWLPNNPPDTWTEWQGQINLPPETAHVMLCLLIDGEGAAWLDDVRDIRDPRFAAAPQ